MISMVPKSLMSLCFQTVLQWTCKAEGGQLEQRSCLTVKAKISLSFPVKVPFFRRQPTLPNHSAQGREIASSERVGVGWDYVILC